MLLKALISYQLHAAIAPRPGGGGGGGSLPKSISVDYPDNPLTGSLSELLIINTSYLLVGRGPK